MTELVCDDFTGAVELAFRKIGFRVSGVSGWRQSVFV